MPNNTYFLQECPTCGRGVQVRVEYLGRKVVCRHCQGKFVATDPDSVRGVQVEHGSALLRRANELLESLSVHRDHQATPPSARR
ncbi:MAG: hypothetical protein ABSG68_18735 [Thermoguttaceae bacterium]|jgi:DNA-directed RNA polymerase subunit RPC12/RpoP